TCQGSDPGHGRRGRVDRFRESAWIQGHVQSAVPEPCHGCFGQLKGLIYREKPADTALSDLSRPPSFEALYGVRPRTMAGQARRWRCRARAARIVSTSSSTL